MYFSAEDIHETSLRHLATEFKDALDRPGSEEEIQQFLTEHPEILARAFIHMTGFIVPKFKFGAEYISDFLVADWRQAWCITLIELEPKDVNAFNRDGTPARRLSQALKQLAEWNQWIKGHSGYFAKRLEPHGEKLISHLESGQGRFNRFAEYLRRFEHSYTENVAILGRRGDNFADEQQRRAALSQFTGNNIEILSYDWLLDLIDENRASRM